MLVSEIQRKMIWSCKLCLSIDKFLSLLIYILHNVARVLLSQLQCIYCSIYWLPHIQYPFIHLGQGTHWEWIALPKNTTWCPWKRFDPGPLDSEASALTMKPSCLPQVQLLICYFLSYSCHALTWMQTISIQKETSQKWSKEPHSLMRYMP